MQKMSNTYKLKVLKPNNRQLKKFSQGSLRLKTEFLFRIGNALEFSLQQNIYPKNRKGISESGFEKFSLETFRVFHFWSSVRFRPNKSALLFLARFLIQTLSFSL